MVTGDCWWFNADKKFECFPVLKERCSLNLGNKMVAGNTPGVVVQNYEQDQ